MQIIITKGRGEDMVSVVRDDGSTVSTRFPQKGPIPHDLVHVVVEEELDLKRGFWGFIQAGHDPDSMQAIAKAAGHSSATRAETPAADFIGVIQAERIVEAFEADHWGGGSGETSGVIAMAEAGCAGSLVPIPDALDQAAVARVRSRLADLSKGWSELPVGGSIRLGWGRPA